ncbi:16S rRNA pseudouridine(516) synthase RsuA [Pontibacter sp. JAM-7]|uniref:16S rRNA pseudouridine(516) synthase RsuA n=1 Tax=Pontibacter sp. JAM-7 TaxID=3366581 RepID=UPI003AF97865
MRLDKYLSHATGLSRKEVQRLLKTEVVSVNDKIIRSGAFKVKPELDDICFEDQNIEAPTTRYLMLHKPEGFVCANDDPTHPTVLSLIDLPRADELIICGRLDIDTTGLVLLTSDGQWAHRITSPKHKTGKCYEVTTADPISEGAERKFAQGMMLHNDKQRTQPAQLTLLDEHHAEVVLTEGRYHQVKRMFAALGNRVTALHRRSIGNITLDPELAPGEYRVLSTAELEGDT